jgi:DNA invertase Pin-like site-specific DNA recombinase
VLLVAKRDRIARKPGLTEAIEDAAAACGARIRSADGASDASGVAGVMQTGFADLYARVEHAAIRERTKAALAAKRARGERTGGIPYGCRLAPNGVHLVPYPAEQVTIARASELRATGISLDAVARQLAAEGHAPRSGGRWHAVQVMRMLARAPLAVDAAE